MVALELAAGSGDGSSGAGCWGVEMVALELAAEEWRW